MLPAFLKPLLWSYNFDSLDLEKHKKLIIGQVLNFGTKEATDWLFSYYGKNTIAEIASEIPKGGWDKKSLALWQLVLSISPQERKYRFQ